VTEYTIVFTACHLWVIGQQFPATKPRAFQSDAPRQHLRRRASAQSTPPTPVLRKKF
jgi:hypothetical protein